MYNDKNPLYSTLSQRDIPPRALVGRSCPTFANAVRGESPLPRTDEQIGRRLCDGSLPEERNEPRQDKNHGGCGEQNGGWGLSSYPLGMVYSPLQEFRELYQEDKALERGTIFAELDLPFEGGRGGCRS